MIVETLFSFKRLRNNTRIENIKKKIVGGIKNNVWLIQLPKDISKKEAIKVILIFKNIIFYKNLIKSFGEYGLKEEL